MSFLLVDQILEFTPKTRATGSLQIPADADDFPLALVVESVGQLAAYIGMENVDFSARPVAATATQVDAHRVVSPGDRLDLEVDVSAMRPNAMRYGGVARIGGEVAVELAKCTGAMLPMDAFDDPEAVRAHMEELRTTGAPERRFPTRAEFSPRVVQETFDAARAEATLEAPEEAEFYGDHFPRRPVYPATLLLDAKIRIAQRLAGGANASADALPPIRSVRAVRVRAFTPPGGRVDVVVNARLTEESDAARRFDLEAFSDGAKISSATVELD